MANAPAAVSISTIEASNQRLRAQRVMLDSDLAALYGVETRTLMQAVQRNRARFAEDFMFRLSDQEFADLRSQDVISSQWGGRRYPPYAFTEQGVAMLSSVLRSERAVQVNIEIMRTFVRLRSLLAANAELASRLDALEARYDERFGAVSAAIRELMRPPDTPPRPLGFPVRRGSERSLGSGRRPSASSPSPPLPAGRCGGTIPAHPRIRVVRRRRSAAGGRAGWRRVHRGRRRR